MGREPLTDEVLSGLGGGDLGDDMPVEGDAGELDPPG